MLDDDEVQTHRRSVRWGGGNGCMDGKAEAEGHPQDMEVAQGDNRIWGRDKDCEPGAMAKSVMSENTCQGGR